MVETPQGREYVRTMMRLSMEQRYPDLAEALGISREQADQLLDLLARRSSDLGVEGLDISSSLAPEGATGEQLAQLQREMQQAFEREISDLLGSNYPKWPEYERTVAARQQEMAVRQQRERLRSVVSSRSNPLSDARFESFAAAIDAEQKRFDRQSGPQSPHQQVERLAERDRRLLEVAATHLDAVQLERYKRHLEQQTQMMRSVLGMMDAVPTP